MRRLRSNIVVVFLLGVLVDSCASDSVAIKTDTPAVISVHDWEGLDEEGAVLGNSPISVEQETLADKVVKIAAEGRATQYWVFTALQGQEINIQTSLAALPPAKEGQKGKEDDKKNDDKEDRMTPPALNQAFRLLLNSYHALASKKFPEAIKIAGSLKEIMPDISAPDIIIGLSYLQQGNRNDARNSFASAKALDPSDAAIDELLRLTQ